MSSAKQKSENMPHLLGDAHDLAMETQRTVNYMMQTAAQYRALANSTQRQAEKLACELAILQSARSGNTAIEDAKALGTRPADMFWRAEAHPMKFRLHSKDKSKFPLEADNRLVQALRELFSRDASINGVLKLHRSGGVLLCKPQLHDRPDDPCDLELLEIHLEHLALEDEFRREFKCELVSSALGINLLVAGCKGTPVRITAQFLNESDATVYQNLQETLPPSVRTKRQLEELRSPIGSDEESSKDSAAKRLCLDEDPAQKYMSAFEMNDS